MSATDSHAQAETLRRLADFLDAHPDVQPLSPGPLWVFAHDEPSAAAWRALLGNPPVDVDTGRGYKAQCRATIGGLGFVLAIHDSVAFAKPAPVVVPQLAEWLR